MISNFHAAGPLLFLTQMFVSSRVCIVCLKMIGRTGNSAGVYYEVQINSQYACSFQASLIMFLFRCPGWYSHLYRSD